MLIVYLDNSESEKTTDFMIPDNLTEDQVWLKFLYRPGHYDLIYEKDISNLDLID